MSERSFSAAPAVVAIPGLKIRQLAAHQDERGVFTEIYREEWDAVSRPVQWNVVTSGAGTLRGVHVHPRHADYLVLVSGRMWLGLADLRESGGDRRSRAVIEIGAFQPVAISIPQRVAHGFLFAEDSMHVYAVSEYFDPADELGCRWDDPELALQWPIAPSRVSARDAGLPSLGVLRSMLP